jgi:hypothetical protein
MPIVRSELQNKTPFCQIDTTAKVFTHCTSRKCNALLSTPVYPKIQVAALDARND